MAAGDALTPQEKLYAHAHAQLQLGPEEERWLQRPETLSVYALRSGSLADRECTLCDVLRWRMKNRELLTSCAATSRSPRDSHLSRLTG